MSFDFEAAVTAPFRMQPGLRRLAPGSKQFTPLNPGSPAQREKLAVLSAFASQALLAQPGFDASAALRVICTQAASEHPKQLQWDGDRARCAPLGVSVCGEDVFQEGASCFGLGDEVFRCLGQLPGPWRLPGLLALAFLEDLAVVDGASASVPWMSVALPSHWSPAEKLGRSFTQIHAPVADSQTLQAAGPQLMALVSQGERWERFVWNLSSHPRLHAHPERVPAERWPAGERTCFEQQAWWRTERQTFIPFKDSTGAAQAIFTIAVEVMPLRQALSSPSRVSALHEALASMTPSVLAYRGLDRVREPLLAWLAACMGRQDPLEPQAAPRPESAPKKADLP